MTMMSLDAPVGAEAEADDILYLHHVEQACGHRRNHKEIHRGNATRMVLEKSANSVTVSVWTWGDTFGSWPWKPENVP